MGYRVEWRYTGSKRCPLQTDSLDVIAFMHDIELNPV